MGGGNKGGFLGPKAIANRIKAKGLQKLRWFCQMCQKQCRDENGFKCHLTSESHQRQLLLFADNPDEYIDTFSQEFLDTFTELLRRRFGTKRVQANIVYQEYISDKEHTHMNATKWETLTEFVKWMGREGHATVDQTEKGWYITYIDRDPAAIARQKASEKKERMELDDEEKTARMIQKQIERAVAEGRDAAPAHEATELRRTDDEQRIVLGGLKLDGKKKELLSAPAKRDNPLESVKLKEGASSETDETRSTSSGSSSKTKNPQKRKGCALDDIMKTEEVKREKLNRKDHWLHQGIVVKIVTKKLGDKFYKQKAVVRDVVDRYAAVIKVLETGDKIKVDQAHLETVIPAIGKRVIVVNGAYREMEATLDALNQDRFSCTVTLRSGLLKGRVVTDVSYEDVSKLYQKDS